MTHQKLRDIWRNPFYYGMWVYGGREYDLRIIIDDFPTIIDEDEYDLLTDRLRNFTSGAKKNIKKQDDIASIRVFDNGFVVDIEDNKFSIALPNKKNRFLPKLEALQKTNPEAQYADFVKPSQIQVYNNKTKKGVTFDKVDALIRKKLSELSISQEDFDAYLVYAKKQLKEIFDRNSSLRRIQQINLSRAQQKKNEFMTENLGKDRDKEKQAIYDQKRKTFDDRIEFAKAEIAKIDEKDEIEILNFETMIKIMKNAVSYYDSASYVQKREIIKILFLNITYHHQNWLKIKVKPGLEGWFSEKFRNGGDGEN